MRVDGAAFDPLMRCFGRLEKIRGEERLTAVALREPEAEYPLPLNALKGMSWQGRWALIAQDDERIFESRRLACLPIDGTEIQFPSQLQPRQVKVVTGDGEAEWGDWQMGANGKLDSCGWAQTMNAVGLLGFLILR